MGSGSGSSFGMNFKPVLHLCEELQRHTNDIDKFTNDLEVAAEKALASWDGAAKTQYNDEKLIWDTAIADMRKNLGGTGFALENIYGNTFRGESKIADSWNGAGRPN